MGQKSHPDRGVVNLGRFEKGEWGELIHSLPFQCKGKKNSVKHNNPGLNRLFLPSLTKTGTSAEPAGLPSCKQKIACPSPPCRLIRLQPHRAGRREPFYRSDMLLFQRYSLVLLQITTSESLCASPIKISQKKSGINNPAFGLG